MNFNVDRIAQLAGLSSAGGGRSSSSLNESAGRRKVPATTYDRVSEALQIKGLEMFYTPKQINEAIASERRLLAEEREMEMEGMCAHCGKSSCNCAYEDMEDGLEEMLDAAGDEGLPAEDEAYMAQAGDEIRSADGGTFVVKTAGKGVPGSMKEKLSEAKLRKVISAEVDRVLAEMRNSGDTSWMYPDGRRPKGNRGGSTLGFAGSGFKR
jgi:hypothetical protein